MLMRLAAVQVGETVLVEAPAGGVGSLLVQLALAAGARVIAAAGGQRTLEFARALGANVLADYTEPTWADRLGLEVGGVDVVFDGVGESIGLSAIDLLRPGGRFCAFGTASGSFVDVSDERTTARHVTVIRGMRGSPAELRELGQAALAKGAAGRLRPLIGQTFALEQAADAHAAIGQRATIGKTLLLT